MFFDQFSLLCQSENTTPTVFVTQVLHLSSSKVTAWKNGSIPKYEILNAIADHFNVTVGMLFDGKPSESEKNDSANDSIVLSEEEERLILDFRNLSEQGQDYVRQQMFMAREVYKKQDVFKADLKAG